MGGSWHKGSRFYKLAWICVLGAFVLAAWLRDAQVFAVVAGAALAGAGGTNFAERWRYRERERELWGARPPEDVGL